MREIVQCLPESARQQFLRLRNQKSEKASDEYQAKQREIRGRHAAVAGERSGQQVLEEWNCSQEFITNLAYAWFEALLETCNCMRFPWTIIFVNALPRTFDNSWESSSRIFSRPMRKVK
jgi:hypothetical protein